jgi:hypothetical protein
LKALEGFVIGKHLAVACALALVADECLAQQPPRDKLPGYSAITFGMSAAQVRTVAKVGTEIPEDGGARLSFVDSVVVDGLSFDMSVKLVKGQVDVINLSHRAADSESTCEGRFQRVFGMIKARYGAPDEAPDVKKNSVMAMRSAFFTFKDGNRIGVTTVHIQSCLTSVAYIRGKGGATF